MVRGLPAARSAALPMPSIMRAALAVLALQLARAQERTRNLTTLTAGVADALAAAGGDVHRFWPFALRRFVTPVAGFYACDYWLGNEIERLGLPPPDGARLDATTDVAPFASVYVQAAFVPHFASTVLPRLRAPVVLVTGGWELPQVERSNYTDALLASSRVACWFSQNPVYPPSRKYRGFAYGIHHESVAAFARALLRPPPAGPRTRFALSHHSKHRMNGWMREGLPVGPRLPIDAYYDLVRSAAFVLSPCGDRCDTYRTYEAIGLGAIPVVNAPEALYGPGLLGGSAVFFDPRRPERAAALARAPPPYNEPDRGLVQLDAWRDRISAACAAARAGAAMPAPPSAAAAPPPPRRVPYKADLGWWQFERPVRARRLLVARARVAVASGAERHAPPLQQRQRRLATHETLAHAFAEHLPGGAADVHAAVEARLAWSLAGTFSTYSPPPVPEEPKRRHYISPLPAPAAPTDAYGLRDLAFPVTHARFDALGPVFPCPAPLLHVFGSGDDEKRVCGDLRAAAGGDCAVVSVGHGGEWSFEAAIAAAFPRCAIHTLDCTMGPAPLPPGLEVTYHRLCLGGRDGGNFATWANFSKTVLGGRAPAVLKMDIEGYEWEVLEALTTAEARAGLPLSISLELHYRGLPGPWADRYRSPLEIGAFMEHLFTRGGYMLVDRHDNPRCPWCTELVIARLHAGLLQVHRHRAVPPPR